MLFRFLNKITVDQRSDAGLCLNGRVFFLGINLVVRIVVQLYFFGRRIIFHKQREFSWDRLAVRRYDKYTS
jgi:hypothetical protein